jgi:D-glycero-D-manno-heptose 1,7-bisphosphate phosphatase
MKIDLIILAGGIGSRIKKITKKIPKPLIKINNKIFLEILIRNFSKYNFEKIYILTGYKGRQIYKKFNNKIFNFIKIKCFNEKKKLGTWGAVNNIKKIVKNNFILTNADSLINLNLHNFINKKVNKNVDIKMILVKNLNYKSNKTLTGLNLSKNRVILNKHSKYMNGGVYYINKKILRTNKYIKFKSLENDIIPDLLKQKKIEGIKTNNFFLDIGTYKNINLAQKKLSLKLKTRAVFLDRDGVINYDNGYTSQWRKFKFKKNVEKGMQLLIKNNFSIFIVTNQAGIAKGYFKEGDFITLHKKIKSYLAHKGIYFNDVKYCPYHPEAILKKYRKNTQFRKPGNLMIKEITKEWDIDIKNSIMIGDKISDKIAAERSGIYFEYSKNNFYEQIKNFIKKN